MMTMSIIMIDDIISSPLSEKEPDAAGPFSVRKEARNASDLDHRSFQQVHGQRVMILKAES